MIGRLSLERINIGKLHDYFMKHIAKKSISVTSPTCPVRTFNSYICENKFHIR